MHSSEGVPNQASFPFFHTHTPSLHSDAFLRFSSKTSIIHRIVSVWLGSVDITLSERAWPRPWNRTSLLEGILPVGDTTHCGQPSQKTVVISISWSGNFIICWLEKPKNQRPPECAGVCVCLPSRRSLPTSVSSWKASFLPGVGPTTPKSHPNPPVAGEEESLQCNPIQCNPSMGTSDWN